MLYFESYSYSTILSKTCYELFFNRTPNVFYFRIFGCRGKCFLLSTRDALDKFDTRSNVDIFVGYSTCSKAYKFFNKKTSTIEESLHVRFDESLLNFLLIFLHMMMI